MVKHTLIDEKLRKPLGIKRVPDWTINKLKNFISLYIRRINYNQETVTS